MAAAFDDSTEFLRVAAVERSLLAGRRLVQPLNADAPTQLAGSAPIIWDLMDECPSVNALLPELQRMFSDSPEAIAGGIRNALEMFLDSRLVATVEGS